MYSLFEHGENKTLQNITKVKTFKQRIFTFLQYRSNLFTEKETSTFCASHMLAFLKYRGNLLVAQYSN
jgi:hypothetical protein